MKAPFLINDGINLREGESLMSSVFALNVTPRNVIFFLFILFFKIDLILEINKKFLCSLDLITLLITDRLVLNLSAVLTIALVSLGKQDPP